MHPRHPRRRSCGIGPPARRAQTGPGTSVTVIDHAVTDSTTDTGGRGTPPETCSRSTTTSFDATDTHKWVEIRATACAWCPASPTSAPGAPCSRAATSWSPAPTTTSETAWSRSQGAPAATATRAGARRFARSRRHEVPHRVSAHAVMGWARSEQLRAALNAHRAREVPRSTTCGAAGRASASSRMRERAVRPRVSPRDCPAQAAASLTARASGCRTDASRSGGS